VGVRVSEAPQGALKKSETPSEDGREGAERNCWHGNGMKGLSLSWETWGLDGESEHGPTGLDRCGQGHRGAWGWESKDKTSLVSIIFTRSTFWAYGEQMLMASCVL
jgi:hypothetical protein